MSVAKVLIKSEGKSNVCFHTKNSEHIVDELNECLNILHNFCHGATILSMKLISNHLFPYYLNTQMLYLYVFYKKDY